MLLEKKNGLFVHVPLFTKVLGRPEKKEGGNHLKNWRKWCKHITKA
jgi:predicted alpha/beta hydrolase